jgi:hypothetical protein
MAYWFPAKRYGRVVLAIFFALFAGGVFLFPPKVNLGAFLIYQGLLAAILFVICWIKGEPPRRRWSGE